MSCLFCPFLLRCVSLVPPQPVPVPMSLPCHFDIVLDYLPLRLKYYRKDSLTIVNNNNNNNNSKIPIRCRTCHPEKMSSHHVGVSGEEMEEGFGGGYELDLDVLEDEAMAPRRVESEEVPKGYMNADLVLPGGPQVAVAVEKDEERKGKSKTEVADMVGSFRMCRGSNALTEEFDEWQFSTESQRNIMASNLAALVFFHIGPKRYSNTYVAQLIKVEGDMDWVLVEDAFDIYKIGHALCSRLRHLSVLLWCSQGQVKMAMRRYAKKPGVCTAYGVWEPETREPPRWPCLRGDSAMEEAEVVVRFKEAVAAEDAKRRKGKLRMAELDGLLTAEVDRWKKVDAKWNSKGDTGPERAVRMPNQLWGCPLLPEWRGAEAVAVVGPEPRDLMADEVVVRRQGEGGRVEGEEEEARGEMSKKQERQRKKNLKYRDNRRKRQLEYKEERDGLKEKIEEKKRQMDEVKAEVEREKKERLEGMQREMEEMEKEMKEKKERVNPSKRKKKQEEEGAVGGVPETTPKADPPTSSSSSSSRKNKGKHAEGGKAMTAALAVDSSIPPPVPSPNPSNTARQTGRGSGRGNGRGRGGWRRDHGGFRQNQTLDEEDLSRRYREATPFLPNASFSAPSSSFEDFYRGVCLLGQTAASAAMAPVATSSPSASRPRYHGRGGQRQGHQQQQRQQGPPAADPDAQRAPQPQGQRGAAPSRR